MPRRSLCIEGLNVDVQLFAVTSSRTNDVSIQKFVIFTKHHDMAWPGVARSEGFTQCIRASFSTCSSYMVLQLYSRQVRHWTTGRVL
jgi:hypothetical protein